jgi:hypothetical protein
VRRSRWLALALIAPVLAACGGDAEDTSSSAPRKPELTVPGESTDMAPTDTGTDTGTETGTDTAPDSGVQGGSGGQDGTPSDQPNPGNGGVPAPDNNAPPQSQEDSPSNDTPPEPGSPADRFEQFCAQNPGAC